MSVVENVDDSKKGVIFGAMSGSGGNKAYPGPEFSTLDEVWLKIFMFIIWFMCNRGSK